MSNTQATQSKGSRGTTIACLVAGISIMIIGYFAYLRITDLELHGGTLYLPRPLWFLYEITGVWGLVAGIELIGLYLLYKAYDNHTSQEGNEATE